MRVQPHPRSSPIRSNPLPSGSVRSSMARSHGPEAWARALASATDAASCTVTAPIVTNREAMASRSNGWSSTTNTVNSSSRGCGTNDAGTAPDGADLMVEPYPTAAT